MIIINGKRCPFSWEELSCQQYVDIIAAIDAFSRGECDFTGFRIAIVEAIIGKFRHDPNNEILCENVFRLSKVFSFVYKYTYDDPRYQRLSQRTKRLIERELPENLDDSDPEIRVARTFKVSVAPNLSFHTQLLPILPSALDSTGYRFNMWGGMAHTSLTAGRYVAANSLLEVLTSDREYQDEALNALIEVLYNLEKTDVRTIPYVEKLAAMYNYIAVTDYVSRLEKYDLIFNRTGANKKRKGSPLGGEASLYALVEKGYGDIGTVQSMDLFTYLDVLLKQTIDCIHQLKAAQMKPTQIAEELGLTMMQIGTVL